MRHRTNALEGKNPTKVEKLHRVLSDGRWHATMELSRRVGHTFAHAKFQLVALGSPRFDLYHEWLWPGAKLGVIFGVPLLLLLAQRWAGAASRAGGPGDAAERREGLAP